MNPTTARLARILGHTTLGAVAQLVLATATASAGPTTGGPCSVPAAPVRQEPAPARPAAHIDAPVRAGDSCAVAGTTAVAQPGMRAVTCGRHRGLNHLTWG